MKLRCVYQLLHRLGILDIFFIKHNNEFFNYMELDKHLVGYLYTSVAREKLDSPQVKDDAIYKMLTK